MRALRLGKHALTLLLTAALLACLGWPAPGAEAEDLNDWLGAAFGWDWLEDPLATAVDVGLLAPEEAGGVPYPRAQEVLAQARARTEGGLEWLHGFYAFGSYDQIGLAGDMDGVSLGWARMAFDPETGPWVNGTTAGNNEWARPRGAESALAYFEERGVPYYLTVFSSTHDKAALPDGTATSVYAAVIRPEYQDAAAAALAAAAEGYGGLTVDFEGLFGAENRARYAQFMEKLRSALPADKGLYVAVPPSDWYTGYDYRALGAVCDKVILMAHDYQWPSVPEEYVGTDNTYTPLAPLDQVYRALCQATDPETGVEDRDKLALAVSFGTAGLRVEEEADILLEARLYRPSALKLAQRLGQADAVRGWSERAQSPWVSYHDESGARYKMWYEDAQSVAAKLRLARLFDIRGLSLWRLGIVPDWENYRVWPGILEEMGGER